MQPREPGFDSGRLQKTNSSDYHYQGRSADVTFPTLTALPTRYRLEGRASSHMSQSSCPEVLGVIADHRQAASEHRQAGAVSKAGVSIVSRAVAAASQQTASSFQLTIEQPISPNGCLGMDTWG